MLLVGGSLVRPSLWWWRSGSSCDDEDGDDDGDDGGDDGDDGGGTFDADHLAKGQGEALTCKHQPNWCDEYGMGQGGVGVVRKDSIT